MLETPCSRGSRGRWRGRLEYTPTTTDTIRPPAYSITVSHTKIEQRCGPLTLFSKKNMADVLLLFLTVITFVFKKLY